VPLSAAAALSPQPAARPLRPAIYSRHRRPATEPARIQVVAWERSRGTPAAHIQKKSTAARTFYRRLAFVAAVFILKARGWLPHDTTVLKCRVEALFECSNQPVRQYVLANGRVHMASFWGWPRSSLKCMRDAISWACETRIWLGIVTARSHGVSTVMLAFKTRYHLL
jgi:hypothetical protein